MSETNTPSVVLVDASSPGNIGMAARAMKNFGFTDLRLIDPPALDPDGEAYGFAGQARDDILPEATETTLDTLVSSHYTVGFTAVTNENATSHVRYPFVTPDELLEELRGLGGNVALVFGRERTGLTNVELERLDRICSIPASATYPSLNLGQAVTITLYELRALTDLETQHHQGEIDRADEQAIERLYEHFESLLKEIGHPPEKRAKAMRMFRRLISRAHPTGREVVTLTGILRRSASYVEPPGGEAED